MIDAFASKIDPELFDRSGKAFYSGRSAFARQTDLYVLGFNPGGDSDSEAETTVRRHPDFVLREAPSSWSAYSDESWKGRRPGGHGMQPRVLHSFRQLRHDPRLTPCSNLIFIRSPRAKALIKDSNRLEELCWPFHHAIIEQFRPRVLVCFGKQAGDRVRRRLCANSLVEVFVERNDRRWTSRAYKNSAGLVVLSLTHPSVADWTIPATDPTPLVRKFLAGQ